MSFVAGFDTVLTLNQTSIVKAGIALSASFCEMEGVEDFVALEEVPEACNECWSNVLRSSRNSCSASDSLQHFGPLLSSHNFGLTILGSSYHFDSSHLIPLSSFCRFRAHHRLWSSFCFGPILSFSDCLIDLGARPVASDRSHHYELASLLSKNMTSRRLTAYWMR
ncbi:hypothetical protein K435DRAFT_854721 [Dendrothele bispora CBS 962.96]|uniref:Uncharacterized protein n=1 Tax=Dendrothele bispora (strain CBS 962.96) TaxID=1314807 RepID=A0A4S8MD88_DENBC|nr:hypothetical protein K435DRAFT_854721 [Dendrothele bispora CBS 962.96]